MSRRLPILFAGLALTALSTVAGAGSATLDDAGIEQRIGESIPLDLFFLDEEGRQVSLRAYFVDRPVILVPVYYDCPMLCPLTLDGLASSLQVLTFAADQDYELVVFSFAPDETPQQSRAAKQRMLERYGRSANGDGWHFLTGKQPSITALAQAIGFRYAWDDEVGQYVHASAMVVATPQGVVSRYFYGVEVPPKDMRLALVESSAGSLGSPIDQALLYCFRYNPATGRYSAVTMNIVRLGGVLTVLVLGSFVGLMLRRERRQRSSEART